MSVSARSCAGAFQGRAVGERVVDLAGAGGGRLGHHAVRPARGRST